MQQEMAVPQDPIAPLQTLDPSTSRAIAAEDSLHQHQAHGVGDDIPANYTQTKQQWSQPRRNMYKVFAAFIGFAIVGGNDGSYGVLLLNRSTSTCVL